MTNLTNQPVRQKAPAPLRDKAHIAFVKAKPCLICGRQPSEAHHVRLGLRTMGKRVCDSKTVPLCAREHAALHSTNERDFWLDSAFSEAKSFKAPDLYVETRVKNIAARFWHERTGVWPEWHSG